MIKMNFTIRPLLKIATVVYYCTLAVNISANNLIINNPSLQGQNKTQHYVLVKFDAKWDNSWRVTTGPSNWDAAWIFVKYRHQGQTTWHHATLNYVDGTGSGDGHIEPSGSNISSTDDNGSGGAYGVFLHASATLSQSNVTYSNISLRWNYGIDGLSDNDKVEVCVFGIEMVYVPQGSFYAGSGGSETGNFYSAPSTIDPYLIGSENSILVGTGTGEFNYTSCGDNLGPIPAAFPKGYKAFYCMKYEITQAQYAAFLNKLTSAQATARAPGATTLRHAISGSVGSYVTSFPFVACNFLSWADVAAYLDWSALRPMTELEFEKAARGDISPVANEYAWGSTSATGATGISNSALSNEKPSNSTANSCYNNAPGVQGPLRAGCFGQGANTRSSTGSGYYGIMELSGNLFERTVTVGNSQGRDFTGLHGNGALDAFGDANVANWPGASALGMGFRGGCWKEPAALMRTSDRFYANNSNGDRNGDYGGRGCRTAP
jgi:formylglycine-generating enzyme required for sulfatase activity